MYVDKTVQAIRKAVEEAQRLSNVEIGSVTVGIAGEHIRSFYESGIITLSEKTDNEISQEDVDRLLNDMRHINIPAGEEILHIIPQDFAVDDRKEIKDPIGISGLRLQGNFQIITASENHLKSIHRVCERAGLEVEAIVLQSVASSYACLQEDEKQEGVALVDIGGGTTDLAIWENGVCRYCATIPFGGNVITEDIRLGCQIMKKHAEVLKTDYGSALASELTEEEVISIAGLTNRPPKHINRRTLARIIQARMEEIAEMVTIEIRNAGYSKRLVGGIVITGGGAYLHHIVELFEYVTGQSARIGYPTENLAKGLVEEASHTRFATGNGLVAYSLAELADDDESVTLRQRSPRKPSNPKSRGGIMGQIRNIFEKTIDSSPIQ